VRPVERCVPGVGQQLGTNASREGDPDSEEEARGGTMIPSLPKSAVAAFLLALLIAAMLTPNVRRFAEAHGWLDQPKDSRRVHRRAVPRVGGLAVVAAF